MENNEFLGSSKQDSPEELPSLFQNITSHSVPGFDNIGNSGGLNYPYQPTVTPTNNPSPNHTSVKVTEASAFPSCAYSSTDCLPKSSLQAIDPHRLHSISISMPSSPAGLQLEGTKRGLFSDKGGTNFNYVTTHLQENSSVSNMRQPKQAKFHSQPIPAGHAYAKAVTEVKLPPNPLEQQQMNLRNNRAKDKCYDSFKTWSGRLERQLSNLCGKQQEAKADVNSTQTAEIEVLPADRYYDALEGPELDTLRTSEELVLPEDKQWPFLLRFPMSSFGICLGINSQAILWKTLAISPATRFLHISPTINLVLWCISVVVMAIISSIYSLKIVFYFEAVRSPSVASLSWATIQRGFDYGARIAYFIALFLYVSLVSMSFHSIFLNAFQTLTPSPGSRWCGGHILFP